MTNKRGSATPGRIWLLLSLSFAFPLVVIWNSTNAGEREQNKWPLTKSAAHKTEPVSAKAASAYGSLPLTFTPNMGQFGAGARYAAHAGNANFYFGPKEIQLVFGTGRSRLALSLSFVGANATPDITSEGLTEGTVNYLIGNDPTQWRTGIKSYGEIVYRDLWPGIDLKFRGENGTLKYEFHLEPKADPRIT